MKSTLIICLLFLSVPAWSQSKTKKQFLPDKEIRQKMNAISGTIRNLGPYIVSDAEFTKDKNKKYIQKSLSDLTQYFKNLKTHSVISTQGPLLNQSIMTEQLEQTVGLFNSDKRSQARAKFSAALNLCINCHTQTPGQELPKLFQDKDIAKMKLTTYEKAELYFITRDYSKAIELYDQFLLNSKKKDDDEFIFKALERELIYFVRVRRSFSEGKEKFDKYLKANLFNDKITQEIVDWNKALAGNSLWVDFNPETTKEDQMEKFMKTFITDDEEGPIFTVTNSSEVYDLNLSTILQDYYNAHPETKLGAKILYWLAILDKRINDDLFFSVGDYYLLSCMEKYSKDPVAADCYDAYEEEMVINYINKENKEFPVHIREKLNSLKKLINYNDAD